MKRIYRHIKRLTLAIPPALALMAGSLAVGFLSVACNKEPDPVPSDGRYVIAFDEVTTKVLITDETLTSFNVWGETESGKANVFNGVTITGSKGSAWTYEDDNDVRYWVENKTYDFFAVAPSTIESLIYDDVEGYGVPFEISDNMAADPVDLVVAETTRELGKITKAPAPVELNFSHTLSKLQVKLKKSSTNSDQTITVKEVYLYGMKGKGVYYFKSGWELDVDLMTVSRTGISEVLDDDAYTGFGEFLMVPQTLSQDSIYLIVSFDYTSNGVTTSRVQIAPVPVTSVSAWESLKTYTYKAEISVDHDMIFESPSVEKWISNNDGGTIIIK